MRIQFDSDRPGGEVTDEVRWSSWPQPHVLGPVECRAAAAWMRTRKESPEFAFNACEVLEVKLTHAGKIEIPRREQPIPWVAWQSVEQRLQICKGAR